MRLLVTLLLLPFFALSQSITLSDSDIAAFYGAVGHGKNTTGGRAQSVYQVTSLANSGPGTLREAVSASNRYIIFRVAGTITLTSDLDINGSNITIAGETAPGDGIAVYGDETIVYGQNVIIRHIRFRGGDTLMGGLDPEDTFRIQCVGCSGSFANYMMDHISVSWAKDENIAIERSKLGTNAITNITISNSIISEGFGGKNLILYGDNITNVSVIGNYFANTAERSIRSNDATLERKSFEMINNLVYNYLDAVQPDYGADFDVIGNVFLDGPSTQRNETIRLEACTDCDISQTSAFISDNIWNGSSATVSSNISPYLSGSAVNASGYTSIGSSAVETSVTDNAGARNGISGLDALDVEMISDFFNGTGSFVSAESGTSGLPTLASGTPYVDDDGDGLSNEYEVKNGAGPGNWFVSPSTRPVTAQLVSGVTIDQTAVTAGIRYTHMDIFLGELAGDWTGGTPGGGGTNTTSPDSGKNATSAMLIAH